ncbi:hypothetical protein B0H16DRAFT_1495078 [Mycena metata]|uniref:Uncharacterized protein n=1 Tax=Mycena metata TaxID=1033252 RepID=A0AAD7P0J0_9AGAR|nr:hypothetical protein B0H16DRAFT_1495078 [Mycena metata]
MLDIELKVIILTFFWFRTLGWALRGEKQNQESHILGVLDRYMWTKRLEALAAHSFELKLEQQPMLPHRVVVEDQYMSNLHGLAMEPSLFQGTLFCKCRRPIC